MATGTGTTDFAANTIAGDATAPDTLKRQIVLIGTTGTNAALDMGAVQGAVTETAPATDTASSGLNGRLQRIAQRITSLIALLPAALGQSTMANSLRVVIASDQSAVPLSRTQSGSTTIGLTSGNSAAIALTGISAVKLFKIATFGNTSIVALKYQVSHDGTNWFDLRSPSGALITQAVTQTATTDCYDVPAECFGALSLRVVAVDSTQALVSQTTASCLLWQGAS